MHCQLPDSVAGSQLYHKAFLHDLMLYIVQGFFLC